MSFTHIGIVGAGGWGTALALLLHENKFPITLWGHDPEEVATMRERRENTIYLRGVPLPEIDAFHETPVPGPARSRAGSAWSLVWGGQLAANAAWSWLFFRKHQGKAALVDLAALESLVAGTIFAAQITKGNQYGATLFYVGFLFIPAMIFTLFLPFEREAQD